MQALAYREALPMSETTSTAPALVMVTPEAAAEVKKLLENEPGKEGLRLEVRGGGCSGMSYGLTFDNTQEGDTVVDTNGVKVMIDPKSAIYLKGTILHFEGGLEGRGFTIKNPQAKGSCGCGQSFNV